MAVQRGTLTTASPITWSDGTLFDGYLFVGLNPPTNGGSALPTVASRNTNARQQLTLVYPIPIKAGVINQNAKLPYNADIQPPNTKYAYYIFDINRRQIGIASALFTVSAPSTTITPASLTVPTAPVSVSVTPES